MKKRIAVFISLLILGSILISLTGCTPDKPTDNADGREMLDIWLPMTESYDIEWWNTQVSLYNEQSTKYYGKISWVDMAAWDSKLLAARENGKAPDVVTYSIGGVAQKALYGMLAPINTYISDLDTYLKDFDSKIVANITALNGNVYGIPRFIEPSMLLFYRKDILSAAGWDQPPVSMAELEQCCADVAKYLAGNSSVGVNHTMQVASTNDDYGWVSWAVQAQVSGHMSSLKEDWSAADLTNYDKVAEYWADLHDFEGVAPQALTSGGYKDIYAAIWEGKCAMQQCGSWIWGTLYSEESYADMRDKIGVAPWPSVSGKVDGEILCSVGGYSVAIDKGSNCPEGAADFIKWCLLTDEASPRLYEFFKAGNFCKISPRDSVNQLIKQTEGSDNELRNLMIDVLMPNAMVEPTYQWEISQSLGNAYVAYVAGGKTASEALAAAEAEINAYIQANKVAENRFN